MPLPSLLDRALDDLAGHLVAGAGGGAEQLRGLLRLGRGGEGGVDQRHREQHGDAERDHEADLALALRVHELGDYRKSPTGECAAMADDPVLLITGASSGIGAATARAAAGELPPGAGGAAAGGAGGAGRGARRRRAGAGRPLRRHRVGPGRGDGRGGAGALRPHRRRLRQRRLRRQPRLPRGVARALALDGPDQRLRGGADDPRHPPPPARARRRPLPDHQLGRRPARPAGLALLGDQVGGDGDRRVAAGGAAPDAREHRASR